MHLEIENFKFNGHQVGIDFEYDEDFRKSVAWACGLKTITTKQLQNYIVNTIHDSVDINKLLELCDEVD